jgi:hypothetical protein
MPEGCLLVLVEAVLPDRARDLPAAIRMDLHMLILLDGKERTLGEFERLFAMSGFRFRRAVALDGSDGVCVLEAQAA